ncbi:MAG: ABC transporter permease [Armatimonadota bacterium]
MNLIKTALPVCFVLCALVILFRSYPDVFTIAFGSPVAFLRLLTLATPLLITGLAVHACLTTGRILIAGEGIYAAGGITVAIVGTTFVDSPLGLWIGLVLSFLIGASLGALISWLRETKGIHEVISGLLMNYILQLLTRYLASGPFRDPTSDAPHTKELPWTLPLLSSASEVNIGIFVCAIILIAYTYLFNKTLLGRFVRSLATTDGVAFTSGLPPVRTRLIVMGIATGLIGLAGAIMIGSAGPFRRFPADFYGSGVGFDGLIVGLLCGPNTWMIVPSTILIAGFSHISDALSLATALPRQVGSVVGASLFIVTAIVRYRKVPRS